MNNQEFAEQLAEFLDITFKELDVPEIAEQIKDFLFENKLAVYNTREQLEGCSIEDVYNYYSIMLANNPDVEPIELTKEQAIWILDEADRINSKHEYPLGEYDFQEAIEKWLEEGCPDYE